jgi:hypothetical protein
MSPYPFSLQRLLSVRLGLYSIAVEVFICDPIASQTSAGSRNSVASRTTKIGTFELSPLPLGIFLPLVISSVYYFVL